MDSSTNNFAVRELFISRMYTIKLIMVRKRSKHAEIRGVYYIEKLVISTGMVQFWNSGTFPNLGI